MNRERRRLPASLLLGGDFGVFIDLTFPGALDLVYVLPPRALFRYVLLLFFSEPAVSFVGFLDLTTALFLITSKGSVEIPSTMEIRVRIAKSEATSDQRMIELI